MLARMNELSPEDITMISLGGENSSAQLEWWENTKKHGDSLVASMHITISSRSILFLSLLLSNVRLSPHHI